MCFVTSHALQVFQTFSCEKFVEIGRSYLRADRRIECFTPTHTAYRTYAAVMIFLCEFKTWLFNPTGVWLVLRVCDLLFLAKVKTTGPCSLLLKAQHSLQVSLLFLVLIWSRWLFPFWVLRGAMYPNLLEISAPPTRFNVGYGVRDAVYVALRNSRSIVVRWYPQCCTNRLEALYKCVR